MALFSTIIQRPGGAPHKVEERADTRAGDGSTYLWCDCPGWKFKASKGGCAHVQQARALMAAGQHHEIVPMTAEQMATVQAFDAAADAVVQTRTRADAAGTVAVPVNVMLAEKVEAPRGKVDADGFSENGRPFKMLTRTDLAFEPKWDGHRMVVDTRGDTVRLWARSQRDITADWPQLTDQWGDVKGVFDGEVIALSKAGEHTFNALQNVGSMTAAEKAARVRFVLWDVLEYDGRVMVSEPYEVRRAHLEDLDLRLGNRIVLTPSSRDGIGTWNAVIAQGLEGVIAKPLRSTYKYGERGTWTKLKSLQRLDLVIIGYTSGMSEKGTIETPFGALLLAERQADGSLVYAGKVGTGFTLEATERLLDTLRPFETDTPPWSNRGTVKKVMTHVGPRKLTWVIPAVTGTIEFQERGKDGVPRFPAWKGIVSVEEMR